MNKLLNVIVKDCRKCPLRKYNRNQHENWDYCSHETTEAYKNILENTEEAPDWCPLGDTHEQPRNILCQACDILPFTECKYQETTRY